MLNKELIQKLKRSNISKNEEKTMERARTAWQNLKNTQKKDVVELTGATKPSIYRVFRTGVISAKIMLPIAQAANINPYYLTGESNDIGNYTDEAAAAMLRTLGYSALLPDTEPKAKRSYKKREKQLDTVEISPENTSPADAEPGIVEDVCEIAEALPVVIDAAETECCCEDNDICYELTEEELIFLLKAVLLRAKAGAAGAIERANKIKQLLLQ